MSVASKQDCEGDSMALRKEWRLCRRGAKVSTNMLLTFPCVLHCNGSNDWQDCKDHNQSYRRNEAQKQRQTEDLFFGKYDSCFKKAGFLLGKK